VKRLLLRRAGVPGPPASARPPVRPERPGRSLQEVMPRHALVAAGRFVAADVAHALAIDDEREIVAEVECPGQQCGPGLLLLPISDVARCDDHQASVADLQGGVQDFRIPEHAVGSL